MVSDRKVNFSRHLRCALADFHGHYSSRDLQVIPIVKLNTVEDRIIKQYPNSLNRMSFPRALHKSVQDGKRSLHVHAGSIDNRIAG